MYICASNYDNTPNPVFEAGACGIPIITTRVGEAQYLIKHKWNGLIIQKNKISLKRAINFFVNNPQEINKFKINIRSDIENNWTWERLISSYKEVFDFVLNN